MEIAFPGWLDETRRDDLLRQAHLLVVPSTWPEPFGLVGVEAGRLGVPAAAFGVGGISEWLTDGVNGVIAPGEPPTIAGLSHAIVACLEDPIRYDSLRLGAIRLASRFTLAAHLENLIPVFRGIRARA